MNIVQFLRILIARRWIIFVALVTCVVVALAVAKSMPERYNASARIMLDIVKPDPVTGQMLGGAGARSYVKTQTELIEDYRIAGDVVDRAGWMQNPSVIAAWQAETGGNGDMRRWAAQRIINSTKAGMVEGSNILEITYQGQNSVVAKNIVSLLREAYIDASLRFKTDSAGQTADWYREQSDRALKTLNAAETAKTRFEQVNAIIMGPMNTDAESGKLAGLQSALTAARTAAVDVQASESARQSIATPVVDQLKMQLATLNDQIEQVGERLGAQHPTYKAMVSRRGLLTSEIARESASARATGAALSGASQLSVTSLEAAYNAQKALVLGMKDKLNELSQMQGEIDMRRRQYESAAQKTADLRLQANSESGLVVLGDAIAGSRPSFPNWPLILGAATGFGFVLGVVVALITELLARRVRGPEDLAFAGKSQVLAVISEYESTPWVDRLRRRFVGKRKSAPDWQPAQ